MLMVTRRTLSGWAVVLLLLALFACTGDTGTGNVTTESVDVAGFEAITLQGVGNVLIEETGEESLRIRTDENFLDSDNISAQVLGGTLVIETEDIVNPQTLEFEITVVDLVRLQVDGLMRVTLALDEVQDPALYLDLAGGTVVAEGDVQELDIEAQGTAEFEGAELASRSATVHAVDVSEVTLNLLQTGSTLQAVTEDTATVLYLGQPSLEVDTSEGGIVAAR